MVDEAPYSSGLIDFDDPTAKAVRSSGNFTISKACCDTEQEYALNNSLGLKFDF